MLMAWYVVFDQEPIAKRLSNENGEKTTTIGQIRKKATLHV